MAESEAFSLVDEFQGADLGDERRSKRLAKIAERMDQAPAASLPEMMGDSKNLQGCYRFLGNEKFSHYDVLEPHFERTAERAADYERVLAIHDQTVFECDYDDQQDAVGKLHAGKSGFAGNFSMLVGGQQRQRPLGVPAVSTIFRQETSNETLSGSDYADQDNREADWWLGHVHWTEGLVGDAAELTHVMDAGFDSYERFARMDLADMEFVARDAHRRKVRGIEDAAEDKDWVKDHAKQIDAEITREVRLTRRKEPSVPGRKKRYPGRKARKTRLLMGSKQVIVDKPRYGSDELPDELELTLVRVWEPDPPEDANDGGVEWLLMTNVAPAGGLDAQGIERVVNDYRARWRIEEYFKALKTGCGYTDRQLETRSSLLKALAISIPMAWLLMAMRGSARQQPDAQAGWYFEAKTLKVLRHFSTRDVPDEPTLWETTMAIAGMGGHQKSNGPPGWTTLRRGLSKLKKFKRGWEAAQSKSDG